MTYRIKISGMMCSHCLKRASKALEALENANLEKIDLESGIAILSTTANEAEIKKSIDDAGYTAEEITAQ